MHVLMRVTFSWSSEGSRQDFEQVWDTIMSAGWVGCFHGWERTGTGFLTVLIIGLEVRLADSVRDDEASCAGDVGVGAGFQHLRKVDFQGMVTTWL